MRITILSLDKTRQNFIKEAEEYYLKRIGRFARIEVLEVGMSLSAKLSVEEIKRKQAAEAIKRLNSGDYVVMLDERGTSFTSAGLAEFLEKKMIEGSSGFCFIIAGAYGADDMLYKRADSVIALSRMTFTYQMSRLILIEQIYRAISIQKGLPYHKE